MRPPTVAAQQEPLERRRREFPAFDNGMLSDLVDFVGRLGIEPPHLVLTDAEAVVPLVETVGRDMENGGSDDRIWLLTRVGSLVGEYFVQRFTGCWFVDDHTETRTFARHVVGQFAALAPSTAWFDPFQTAGEYVDLPPGRALAQLPGEVEREIKATTARSREART